MRRFKCPICGYVYGDAGEKLTGSYDPEPAEGLPNGSCRKIFEAAQKG